MAHAIRSCLVPIGCALAALADAGELRLVNGALVPGELQRLEADKLVWEADLIGTMRVPKSAVASLRSERRVAVLPGADQPPRKDCLVAIESGTVTLDCADGKPAQQASFAALRDAPSDRTDSGKLAVSLDLERGSNRSEDQIDLDARAERRRGQRRHTFEGSVDYEQNASETTEDEAELLYQGDYLLGNGWFVYGLGEYRRDREAAIQESLLAGIGAGYEFTPLAGLDLRLQAGLNEVQFNLEQHGKEVEESGTIRWRASWQLPWRGLELTHEGDYGVVLQNTDIYLVETKSALSVPIGAGWVGQLRLDYDHYGISAEGGGRTDIEWVFGLGYRW